MPSFILIRSTVWPQYTNVTDRQDRQRTDSIGRTVLQTVAQKSVKFREVLLLLKVPEFPYDTGKWRKRLCQNPLSPFQHNTGLYYRQTRDTHQAITMLA